MFSYNFDMICIFSVFISGVFVFCSMRKHLLVTLLSLEYLVVLIYLCLVYFVMSYFGDVYLILLFLTFSVCEGVLGLSILVSMIRCHGNDQVNSLFFVKW